MDNPSVKDTQEGVSTTAAGREFHKGTVLRKKLNLKESVEVENCLYFLECADLNLVVDGVKYSATGMSFKSLATL